ncbi:hypothetical protein LAG90_16275 [Marinilongibacter aquaticus]|uniref:hypothetical protein n=1 Tax=Marinilongibacter aquaticus TaxID=2975157 RepID=UPI0021BD6292|nr:hypothetical protein [Marinilongibacter aquaticus]UBM58361.1 hypothetical protein LAG90_16275 [Marinilongibacter aquaticus]
MKNISIILLLLAFSTAQATIRRVNNNAGIELVSGLVYSSFDAAYADAVNGDTLYIEPSVTNYTVGNPLTKRLVVIGDAYQKGPNNSLQSPLSFSLNESVLANNFSVDSGAENSAFYGIRFFHIVTVNCQNVLFKRCSFTGSNAQSLNINGSANLVEQCYFHLGGGGHSDISGTGSGNIFRNCIFSDIFLNQKNPIVDQCILGGVQNVVNGTFSNCIVGTNTYSPGTNSTFTNCLKIGAAFNAPGSNNIENAAFADVFISGTDNNGNPFDSQFDKEFRLKAASLAENVGTSGQDLGPFDGADPYRLSGQPPVPVITNFYLETTGSSSSGINGSITIQANN